MATEPPPKTDAPAAETDQLFRLQVAIGDFFVNNARYFGYLLGVVLVGALLYGVWDWWTVRTANVEFGAIAEVDYRMPKVDEMARLGLVPMDDPADAARLANVEEGARRYEAAAKDAGGTAAVYAWLKAAETWRRLGKADPELAALEQAHAGAEKDAAGFAAAAAYANALADRDRLEEAAGVLREAVLRVDGLYAEELLIQLAGVHVAAGKPDDARLVAGEFGTRFPDSPRAARMAAVVGAPAAAPGAAPAAGTGG